MARSTARKTRGTVRARELGHQLAPQAQQLPAPAGDRSVRVETREVRMLLLEQ
ncbi:hypothetical protein AB0I94_20610 [Streptomyces sp. NPDC050147]|uniref:hypothetical protein n=1 Tax=Streptomyces sp. NPDC050147 TaxID=3155513 RepID=UPI0034208E84